MGTSQSLEINGCALSSPRVKLSLDDYPEAKNINNENYLEHWGVFISASDPRDAPVDLSALALAVSLGEALGLKLTEQSDRFYFWLFCS